MQHINLYNQLDKVVEPPFSARQQFMLLSALLIFLLFVYAGVLWQQTSWAADFSVAKQQQDELLKQFRWY